MAGVGFELKKLFVKRGLLHSIRAYAVSSVITVGPMILFMLLIIAAQLLMSTHSNTFVERELLFSGAVYTFVFSYVIVSIFQMTMTRAVSDMLYQRKFSNMLPLAYQGLIWSIIPGAVVGLLFVVFAPLELSYRLGLYIFFMELILIWHFSTYISALKKYFYIFSMFAAGSIIGLGSCMVWTLLLHNTPTASAMIIALSIGLGVTVCGLAYGVEYQYSMIAAAERENGDETSDKGEQDSDRDGKLLVWMKRYPSLIGIGAMMALGLYAHQIIRWFKSDGVWVEDVFRLAPQYDVAVYYALLTTIPTLVLFVVKMETSFYPKCREYYALVLGKGSMKEIEQARVDLKRVLTYELTVLMGVQLFFTMTSIALGIRLLPNIGFTPTMIEVYNMLVLAFYAYTLFVVVGLLLLYFDDRKGVLALSGLMLAMAVVLSASLSSQQTGFAMFAASYTAFVASLLRLRHMTNNLHYYTFSAQPLVFDEPMISKGK